MLNKTILVSAISCLLVSMSANKAVAQQRNTIKEDLFIQMPQSATLTPNSSNARASVTLGVKSGVEHAPYRSFDGTNNNMSTKATAWGSANIPLLRELPADYGPNNSLAGSNRPSARAISNLVVDEPVTIFNARNVSTVNYQWGQFLDHEITLTPTGSTESAPISLPRDEPLFTEPISFFRSAVYPGTGGSTVREQFNLNTAWIDGSVVYGSDEQRARWLRTFKNGKLKTSAGNLLPFNTLTGEQNSPIDPKAPGMANDGNKTIKTFVAGDIRAAENPVLASFHTLFVREHNRLCNILIARGMKDDEKIYQTARKIVGGEIQNITYEEFLPSLGISLRPYNGYKNTVRPDITNIFATAGFRLGHSMVADEVLLFDNNCQPLDPESLELDEIFWEPQLVVKYTPEVFLKGTAAHTQYETNIKINSVLRNLLFGDPASPVRFGVDLASLNIQRGRDHGLPDYNTVRKFYTGKAATRFSDISRNDTLARNLKSLYGNINNVDLWTGVLAEDLMPRTSIGKLAHEIQRIQFEKLRDGDFYYFKNDPFLSKQDRNTIKKSSLAEIIERNMAITNLQCNVFFAKGCPGFSTTPASVLASNTQPPDAFQNNEANSKIFPNPSINEVTVVLDNPNQSGIIQLFSENGSLVKTIVTDPDEISVQIDISDLPKGIYAMKIVNSKTIKSVRLLRQ